MCIFLCIFKDTQDRKVVIYYFFRKELIFFRFNDKNLISCFLSNQKKERKKCH